MSNRPPRRKRIRKRTGIPAQSRVEFESPFVLREFVNRYILGMEGDGVLCPYCGQNTTDQWISLLWYDSEDDEHNNIDWGLPSGEEVKVSVQWMPCGNSECSRPLVQIVKSEGSEAESWLALPKGRTPPPLHASIPQRVAEDYREAWKILDDSWRMSAVLSRRILADLLVEYGGVKSKYLKDQIDEFSKGSKCPSDLLESLDYLREIGNFAAHAIVDPSGNVVEVTKEEAEWTLAVIADFFEHYIVRPEVHAEKLKKMKKRVQQARGKKPAKPKGKGGT